MPPFLTPLLTITYVWILHHETAPFGKAHFWGSYLEANVLEIKNLEVSGNFYELWTFSDFKSVSSSNVNALHYLYFSR